MPFEKGSFPVSIFKLTEELPDNASVLFSKNHAGQLEDVSDEPQIGWTGHNHLLETNIDEENTTLGGFIFANLRTAKKKISSSILKADLAIEELAYIKATGNSDIPRKKKKEIKEFVTDRLLKESKPQFTGNQVVIDQTDNTIYLSATSLPAIDTFTALFNDTFNIAPIQMLPEGLMEELNISSTSYQGLRYSNKENDDFIPGRDFLTWLWYYSEENGGEVDAGNYGTFAVMLDGPLTFASDGEGAFESVVRKGNPLSSAEAKTSLSIGKKLKKANFIFVRAEDKWSCSFDADNFAFSGINLPEGEEMDHASRFAERINNLHIFKEVFKLYFNKFLDDISNNSETINNRIIKWIETRISC